MYIDKIVPKAFQSYINSTVIENIETLNLKKVTFTITKEEALEDLRIFKYIMDNAYSGREYWENHGIYFKNIYCNIQTYINSHELIYKQELFNLYIKQLQDIHDGHLGLLTHKDRVYFGEKYKAYFADILLRKHKDKFEVIFSKEPRLTVSTIFTSQQLEGKLFRTLSPTGEEHFLLGCRSWNEINKLTLSFDGETISLPVHPCRATDYEQDQDGIFLRSKIDGVNVVTSTRFWEWDDKIAEDFYNCGLSLRNESTLIWNLMGNGGGNSNYPLQFIKGLNEYSYWKIDCAVLSSPAIKQIQGLPLEKIQNKREWVFWNAEERDVNKGTFEGTLYVLSNDNIASSSEAALNIAQSVKNCVIVGQNSSGVGVFGDVLTYQLPYSDIQMRVPYKLFLGGANEGEGFEPDFWIDSINVQGELIAWLKDPDNYLALK